MQDHKYGERNINTNWLFFQIGKQRKPVLDDVAWNLNIQENKLVGWHQYSFGVSTSFLLGKRRQTFI
jgi:hypothetical protein